MDQWPLPSTNSGMHTRLSEALERSSLDLACAPPKEASTDTSSHLPTGLCFPIHVSLGPGPRLPSQLPPTLLAAMTPENATVPAHSPAMPSMIDASDSVADTVLPDRMHGAIDPTSVQTKLHAQDETQISTPPPTGFAPSVVPLPSQASYETFGMDRAYHGNLANLALTSSADAATQLLPGSDTAVPPLGMPSILPTPRSHSVDGGSHLPPAQGSGLPMSSYVPPVLDPSPAMLDLLGTHPPPLFDRALTAPSGTSTVQPSHSNALPAPSVAAPLGGELAQLALPQGTTTLNALSAEVMGAPSVPSSLLPQQPQAGRALPLNPQDAYHPALGPTGQGTVPTGVAPSSVVLPLGPSKTSRPSSRASLSEISHSSSPPPGFGLQPSPMQPTFVSDAFNASAFRRRNTLPRSALGGFAASHPPGLGTRIFQSDTSEGTGIIMSEIPGAGEAASSAATAMDFTKRKGWPLRVMDELVGFIHVLDLDGRILYTSPNVTELTRWRPGDLKGQRLIDLIHPDDTDQLREALNPRTQQHSTEIKLYFRFCCKPDWISSGKVQIPVGAADASTSSTDVGGKDKKGTQSHGSRVVLDDVEYVVFEMVGHPYFAPPAKEFEATLQEQQEQRVQEEVDAQQVVHTFDSPSETITQTQSRPTSPKKASQQSELASNAGSSGGTATELDGSASFPPLQLPTVPTGLTVPEPLRLPSLGTETPTSSPDGPQCFFLCRVHPAQHGSVLEEIINLKDENERLRHMIRRMHVGEHVSHQQNADLKVQQALASTAGQSGTLDAPGDTNDEADDDAGSQYGMGALLDGSTAAPDADAGSSSSSCHGSLSKSAMGDSSKSTAPRSSSGRKKQKSHRFQPSDQVCTDCGRTESAEWRKGPLGPKTLCNACGLRWAKRIKRKGGDPNVAALAFQAAQDARAQVMEQAAQQQADMNQAAANAAAAVATASAAAQPASSMNPSSEVTLLAAQHPKGP